jgi:hypothetical protein
LIQVKRDRLKANRFNRCEGGIALALALDYNARKFTNGAPSLMLKFAAMFVALTLTALTASAQGNAEDGRIHITFSKGGHGGGSGYLFYQGQKYGLGISSTNIGRVWVTTIDLLGTASNLRSAADIIGTYSAADAETAIVRRAKTARLKNGKGVVLEIRAVNLGRWSALNLSGMTIKALGWHPPE